MKCRLSLFLGGDPSLQSRAQFQDARDPFDGAFRIGLVHELGDQVPNLLPAVDQFSHLRALLRLQAMNTLSQVV